MMQECIVVDDSSDGFEMYRNAFIGGFAIHCKPLVVCFHLQNH